jgi:DNA transformation protein
MRPKPSRDLHGRPQREGHSVGALLNIGPKSSAWLQAAGITSVEQVRKLGPVGVCRELMAAGKPASVLLAYALEGGLSGTHWNAIPWETKQAIRAEFAQMKLALKKRRPA